MDRMIEGLIGRYPELRGCAAEIEAAYSVLRECFAAGGKLLVCGNGGSAADSEHIVAELMKGFLHPRPVGEQVRFRLAASFPGDGAYLAAHLQNALPAISLVSQVSLQTAYANDVAPDMAFAQQVFGYGREGDAVLGISTSGNSPNVLHALQVGRALGLRTIGLTGASGGRLQAACNVTICVPCENTPEIQERHVVIYHTICAALERDFFVLEA
jgi:D-sedoheptulose 7-phosphate isomerase